MTPTRLHAVVQTGKEGEAGIYYLTSSNEGRDWSEPHRLAGEEAHYADLAATDDELAIVWQEQRDRRTVVVGALSDDAGKSWSEPRDLSDTAASASYPRVVATSTGFRALWTESEDGRKHGWVSTPFRRALTGHTLHRHRHPRSDRPVRTLTARSISPSKSSSATSQASGP